MLKSILRDGIWAFAIKLLGVFSSLIVQAILARALMKEELGYYFLLLSVATFGAMVARVGMRQTIVKFVAESLTLNLGARLRKSLKIVYLTVTAGTVTVLLIGFTGFGNYLIESVFKMSIDTSILWLLGLWMSIIAFQIAVAESFRGLHEVRRATFVDGPAGNLIIVVMLMAAFIFKDKGVSLADVISIICGALFFNVVGHSILLRQRVSTIEGGGNITAREIFSVSVPIYIINLSLFTVGDASFWVAGAFLVATDVADLGVVLKLILLVTMPLLIINLVVQPMISRLFAMDEIDEMEFILRGTSTAASLVSLIITATLLLFPEAVLALVFGPGFSDAKIVLIVLALGKFVHVWAGSSGNVLMLTGHQKDFMLISLVTGAGAILAYILCVENWGIEGIAIVCATGWAVQNVASVLVVKYRMNIWTHADFRVNSIRLYLAQLTSIKPDNLDDAN
jgi:O-antigen/teichoic acid export membrane protein